MEESKLEKQINDRDAREINDRDAREINDRDAREIKDRDVAYLSVFEITHDNHKLKSN